MSGREPGSLGADGIVVLAIDRGIRSGSAADRALGCFGLEYTPHIWRRCCDGRACQGRSASWSRKAGVGCGAKPKPQGGARSMANAVGVQALVAALPLLQDVAGDVQHLQHRMGLQAPLAAPIRELIASEQVSEVLVIDAAGEGEGQGFNTQLLQAVEAHTDLPLLAFGGMAQPWQIRPLLSRPQLSGVVVGQCAQLSRTLHRRTKGSPHRPISFGPTASAVYMTINPVQTCKRCLYNTNHPLGSCSG